MPKEKEVPVFDLNDRELDQINDLYNNVQSHGTVSMDFDRTEEATNHFRDMAIKRGII